jgi:outer membrane protein, heavy metal efflux system
MESAARFNALQARVITEIDRAVAVYRATRENLSTLEALAADQQKQSDAVAAQAKAGAADELDLLNSQLEVSAGALVQLDGRIKAQQAYDALEDAMQRPLAALNPGTIEQRQARATKENQP